MATARGGSDARWQYQLAIIRRRQERLLLQAARGLYRGLAVTAADRIRLGARTIDVIITPADGQLFTDTLRPLSERTLEVSYEAATSNYRITVPTPVFDAELARAATRSNVAPLAMRRRVLTVLQEFDRGDRTIAEAIREVRREGLKDWRGRRLARTEVSFSTNDAAAKAYNDGGMGFVRLRDGPRCGIGPGHNVGRVANGVRVSIDEWRRNLISHPNCVRFATPIRR